MTWLEKPIIQYSNSEILVVVSLLTIVTTEMIHTVFNASIPPSLQTRHCADALLIVSCSFDSGVFHKWSDKSCVLHHRRWRNRSDCLHAWFGLCCFCGRGRDTKRSGDITTRLISDTSGSLPSSPRMWPAVQKHSHAKRTPTRRNKTTYEIASCAHDCVTRATKLCCLARLCVMLQPKLTLVQHTVYSAHNRAISDKKCWKLGRMMSQKFSISSHLAKS